MESTRLFMANDSNNKSMMRKRNFYLLWSILLCHASIWNTFVCSLDCVFPCMCCKIAFFFINIQWWLLFPCHPDIIRARPYKDANLFQLKWENWIFVEIEFCPQCRIYTIYAINMLLSYQFGQFCYCCAFHYFGVFEAQCSFHRR